MTDPLKGALKKLEDEINGLLGPIHEVSLDMIREGYTRYPIYVAHEGVMEIGELLFDAAEYQIPYSLHVSSLEEFQEAGIIPEDKTELFRIAYGDPKQFICVFFVFNEEARFVFYPFAKRITDTNNDPD